MSSLENALMRWPKLLVDAAVRIADSEDTVCLLNETLLHVLYLLCCAIYSKHVLYNHGFCPRIANLHC